MSGTCVPGHALPSGRVGNSLKRTCRRTLLPFLALACAVAALCPHSVRAREGKPRTILIVNSYPESSPWSNSLVSVLTQYGMTRDDVGLFIEHMNVLMIGDRDRLHEYQGSLAESFATRPPDVVVVLGNPAFRLLEKWMRDTWGEDLPIILCAEKDYTGSEEAYLFCQSIPARSGFHWRS